MTIEGGRAAGGLTLGEGRLAGEGRVPYDGREAGRPYEGRLIEGERLAEGRE